MRKAPSAMLWNISGAEIAGELEDDAAEQQREEDEGERPDDLGELADHRSAPVIAAPTSPSW